MSHRLLFVAIIAFSAVVSLGQRSTFVSNEFGFSMSEPAGWAMIEKRTLDDNLKQFEIGEPAATEDDILLFAFTKYAPNARRGLNPKIEARVIATGLKRPLTFAEFQPAISRSLRTLSVGQRSYSYLIEPSPIDVFGARGVYQISRFTMRTKDRTEYYVRSRTYAIPYKTYYFQISFVDEVGGEDCSAVFDELVKSIKIGHYL